LGIFFVGYLWLTPKWQLILYVGLGQAHFIQAWWRDIYFKKISALKIVLLFLSITAILLALENLKIAQAVSYLALTLFSLHLYLDHKFVNKEDLRSSSAVLVISYLLAFQIMALVVIFENLKIFWLCVLCAGLNLIWLFRNNKQRSDWLFTAFNLSCVVLASIGNVSYFMVVVYIVTLVHFFDWHKFTFMKYSAQKRRQFVGESIVFIGAVVLASALFYHQASYTESFRYFFLLSFYLAWSLVHQVDKARFEDFKTLAQLLNPSRLWIKSK
jgi:hypothetical protein